MTERWRKRLGDLDKASPGDEVYERAKGGPRLPEEAIARPSTSSRVVTGLAAFLIFALAISVFAIPALRLRQGAGGSSLAGVQPLWPWPTVEEVEKFTEDPSPIGFMGSQAFFDPFETAWGFGHEVLGWDEPQVTNLTGFSHPHPTTICEVATPISRPMQSSASGFVNDAGSNCAVSSGVSFTGTGVQVVPGDEGLHGQIPDLGAGATGSGVTAAPVPPSSVGSSPFSPYRVVEVSQPHPPCPPNVWCLPPESVIVTVYQPLGSDDGNVWAVSSATQRNIGLSVGVGSVLRDGSSVEASVGHTSDTAPLLAVHIGAGDCDLTLASAEYSTLGPSRVRSTGASLVIDLPQRPDTCSVTEPGHAFVAVRPLEFAASTIDPLLVAEGPPIVGFAAVPVVIDWSGDGVEVPTASESVPPSSSPPPSAMPLEWTTHTDSLGWTMDVPTDWQTEPIDGSSGRLSYQGAAFSDGPIIHTPGGPQALSVDQPFVLLEITHREGGPFIPTADDSAFPLSYDAMSPEEGGLEMSFRGDGVPFEVWIRFSGGTPSLQQEQILRRMVGSIAFERWELGETRNGWTAATDPSPPRTDDVIWALAGGNVIALVHGEGRYVGLDIVDTCGEGQNMTSMDGEPLIECPNGTTIGYTIDGQPLPDNPDRYQVALEPQPVIRSWDGALLVAQT